KAPTRATTTRIALALQALAAKHPDGIVMLNVLEGTGATPSAEVRQRIARDMKHYENVTRAIAVVYEAKGFLAATVRAIVTGLQAMSRQRAPLKVFATVADACLWLSHSGFLRSDSNEIVAAVQEVRSTESAAS